MSTAKFNTLQNAAGSKSVPVDTVVDGSAKAWVNFNGTGTVAIRAAFNVSSITDNGVGDYTLNFTTALADANFAAQATSNNGGILDAPGATNATKTTTALGVNTRTNTGALSDVTSVSVSIFR